MTEQRFSVDFDRVSEMYRDLDNGQYRMGPPRDWDSEADRFRAKSGRFKRQTNYGPDDQWGRSDSREFQETPLNSRMSVLNELDAARGVEQKKNEHAYRQQRQRDDPILSDTDDRRTLGLPEVELDFGGL